MAHRELIVQTSGVDSEDKPSITAAKYGKHTNLLFTVTKLGLLTANGGGRPYRCPITQPSSMRSPISPTAVVPLECSPTNPNPLMSTVRRPSTIQS